MVIETKEFTAMAGFVNLACRCPRMGPRPPGYRHAEYQRLFWDALCKSIINRVDTGNIKHVVPELFSKNLIRKSWVFRA
jgi:hypothetical protein